VTAPSGAHVRVVIVDDHTLFREGLREVISAASEFVVVAEGSTAHEAVRLADEHKPDVLLLDVEMPGPDVGGAVPAIKAASPATRIVILTMHDQAAVIERFVEGGVAAYLTKDVTRNELLVAMRAAMDKPDRVLLSASRRAVLGSMSPRGAAGHHVLSFRELEVLGLVAVAFSNAQIARRLHISEGTVKRHLTNIYAKLGATSRVDAILKAKEAKLIGDPRAE
jgi:DNA-binding NarL/FixJ family response regulator